MHRTVEITFAPSGEVGIEATGFKGNACEKATQEIETLLGTTTSRRKKSEYFAMTATKPGLRQTT